MNRKSLITLGAAAAVLALGACSSGSASPEASETPESRVEAQEAVPTVEEPETAALSGVWVAESYTGAVMTVEWDIDPTDERVAELEAFRVATGAEEVSYTAVDIDNRQGTDYQNLYPTEIFDEAGAVTELIDGQEAATAWAPELIWSDDGGSDRTVNAAGEEISEEDAVALNGQWVALDTPSGAAPGERVTVILVGPADLPDDAAGVILRDASAYPVEGQE